MIKETFPHGIALIGFMGTGKTTIARELSARLDRKLINVDTLIQEKMDMSVKEIFNKYGEGYFREIEKDTIAGLKGKLEILMDCGGGVPLNSENIENIKENNKIVLLEASPETILERVKNDNTRPLLNNNMSIEDINTFLLKRRDFYNNAADIRINTDDKSIEDIINEIIEKIYDNENERKPLC